MINAKNSRTLRLPERFDPNQIDIPTVPIDINTTIELVGLRKTLGNAFNFRVEDGELRYDISWHVWTPDDVEEYLERGLADIYGMCVYDRANEHPLRILYLYYQTTQVFPMKKVN